MKNTIIALIQQDIQHTQFIESLNALGLTADNYYLNLNSIIFDLMQLDRSTFENSEVITNVYYKLIQEAVKARRDSNKLDQEVQHTRTDRDELKKIAVIIYNKIESLGQI